jgi:hypothetical protein
MLCISVSRGSYAHRLYMWTYRVLGWDGPSEPSIIRLLVRVPLLALVHLFVLIGFPLVVAWFVWLAGLVVTKADTFGWWLCLLLPVILAVALGFLVEAAQFWSRASTWFRTHCYEPVQRWYNQIIPRVTFQ